jgi:hypothetical protein
MLNRRVAISLSLVLTLTGGSAAAQKVTTTDGLSLRQTVTQLTVPVTASPAVGEAINLATALEVATSPLATSAGAFVFKVDPATGLRVRTATTFGPAFSERVLTAGEGKISVAANLTVATYDKLGSLELSRMPLTTVSAPSPTVARQGLTSLVLSSETMSISGAMGATDKIDVLFAVPLVKVKLDGISWVETAAGEIPLRVEGGGIASGLGDIAVGAKFRLLRFGEDEPDPGGIGFILMNRLPTGDTENFRGLGIYRSLGSVIVSMGRGKLRPHANGGFEWWSKGITVVSDSLRNTRVTVRHQWQYSAGVEFEASPKLTLLVDGIGRHIRGGGRVGYRVETPPPNPLGVTGVETAITLAQGIQKFSIAPGVKWNVKGTFVLSFNSLIAVKDSGLHDRFTPVVGVDWTF